VIHFVFDELDVVVFIFDFIEFEVFRGDIGSVGSFRVIRGEEDGDFIILVGEIVHLI
jgi:hypothetical protein